MDLQNLSSNWKRLQPTLAQSPSDSKEKISNQFSEKTARKIFHSEPRSIVGDSSKDSSQSRKRKRTRQTGSNMGGYVSSLTGSPGQPNANRSSSSRPSSQKKENDEQQLGIQTTPNGNSLKMGKYVAVDCEMVGTTDPTPFSVKAHQQSNRGPPEFSILARATLVNYNQEVIYDAYVLPPPGVRVTNYRTEYSGISKEHLDPNNATFNAKSFAAVQEEVASLIKDRVIIGHALRNDLEVLGLTHPVALIRDTSRYPKFRQLSAVPGKQGRLGKGRTPALRVLASEILHWDIQNGGSVGHDSAEDARAAMALFKLEKKGFEEEALKRYGAAALPSQKTSATANLSPTVGEATEEQDEDDDKGDQDEESTDDPDDPATEAHKQKKKKNRKKKKGKGKGKSRNKR